MSDSRAHLSEFLGDLTMASRSDMPGFDKRLAHEYVESLCQFHRMQVSPEYRAALDWCRELVESWGISTQLHQYLSDGVTRVWTLLTPEGWDCRSAQLWAGPEGQTLEKLCDYKEVPMSLVERSAPLEECVREVVVVDDPDAIAPDTRKRLKDNWVLTSASLARVREIAVQEHGALGILYHGGESWSKKAERGDDARVYGQFWWVGPEKRCPGFVLTPAQGRRLAELAKKGPVQARAHVDARFYKGTLDLLSARVPGESDEEVLVVAHLDHPKPGANDNNSGCAVALELLRALHRGREEGRIPRLPLTVNVLITQEITGTIPYIAAREDLEQVVAVIALDMVGHREEGNMDFMATRVPAATCDAANDVLKRMIAGLGTVEGQSWNFQLKDFCSGSDHYAFCDSTVGIPATLLARWPDPRYHSTLDTPEFVDPDALAAAGAFTWAFIKAACENRDILRAGRGASQAKAATAGGGPVYRRAFKGPIMLRTLLPDMTPEQRVLFGEMVKYPPDSRHRPIDSLILALNWMDGRRSLDEVLALVESEVLESAVQVELVRDFTALLRDHNLLVPVQC